MKILFLLSSISSIPAADTSSSVLLRGINSNNIDNSDQHQPIDHRILQNEEITGTFYIKEIEYEEDEDEQRNLQGIWNRPNRPNKNKKRRKKQTLNIGLEDGTFREIETADGDDSSWAKGLVSGRNVSCYFAVCYLLRYIYQFI